jgi:N-acetylmuramoyl-L-alanine amidase
MYIDFPSPSSSLRTSPVIVSGWALDNLAAISQVSLAIDGVFIQNAFYNLPRADVCAAYPGRIGCPNVGWTSLVDVSSLASGAHTLTVTGTTTGGRSSVLTSSFTSTLFSGTGLVVIDRPSAQSGVLAGPVSLYGWALAGIGAVSRVDIAIDGVRLGQAHYADSREDVCNVYKNAVGCPYVGWDYLLDTTQFSDGAHTVQATEFDASGHYTSTASFTVANGGNPVNPTKIYIDQPNPQETLLGTTTISGWALNDTAAITSVAVFVDGIQKGTAIYGANRPDVCAVYPNRTGCPNVGWTYSLDTTQLANGQHVLQATAGTGQTQYGSTSTVFTAANWTTNPSRITIDRPAQATSSSGVVNAYGWAIDDYEAVAGISISIDGVSYGPASYGASRGDVCAAFSGRAGCPNVGWNFLLDTRLLSDGPHVAGVTSTTAGGRHATVTSPFSVSNSAGNPIQVTIDSPASGTVSGLVGTYGWALEGGSQISSVRHRPLWRLAPRRLRDLLEPGLPKRRLGFFARYYRARKRHASVRGPGPRRGRPEKNGQQNVPGDERALPD